MIISCFAAAAQAKKPNIVVIWGDDIGQSNISSYTHGLMGYQTPNIDRAEREYAYDRKSHVGTLDKALDQADAKGWHIVDMKKDWNKVFPGK
jgi:hypothetical protein